MPTEKEQKRLRKLEQILAKLENGAHIQNRMLKVWLTADEYAEMESEFERQRLIRQDYKDLIRDKPEEIRSYETQCREAYFLKAKWQSYNGRKEIKRKRWNAYESKCEEIKTYLEETVIGYPELEQWFDYDFKSVAIAKHKSIDDEITHTESLDTHLEVEALPRVWTSKKTSPFDAEQGNYKGVPWLPPLMSINEVKQEAVKSAIQQITNQETNEIDTVRIKTKLKALTDKLNKE